MIASAPLCRFAKQRTAPMIKTPWYPKNDHKNRPHDIFPYRNKVKMLISVAKIRQVSEFAKLLAEILSEVAKRRNGSQRWLPFLYSHLWGTGTHTQVPDPMTSRSLCGFPISDAISIEEVLNRHSTYGRVNVKTIQLLSLSDKRTNGQTDKW